MRILIDNRYQLNNILARFDVNHYIDLHQNMQVIEATSPLLNKGLCLPSLWE